jgi:hypothetical protein
VGSGLGGTPSVKKKTRNVINHTGKARYDNISRPHEQRSENQSSHYLKTAIPSPGAMRDGSPVWCAIEKAIAVNISADNALWSFCRRPEMQTALQNSSTGAPPRKTVSQRFTDPRTKYSFFTDRKALGNNDDKRLRKAKSRMPAAIPGATRTTQVCERIVKGTCATGDYPQHRGEEAKEAHT